MWLVLIVSALIVSLGLYAFALVLVALYCTRPMRIPLFLSPRALGLPQESIRFHSQDQIELRGWWMHHEKPPSVVVMCHGYMMNRAEGVPLAKRLYESGIASLTFDFRAHGLSGGKQTTIGYNERLDVQAAIALARNRYPETPIWIWGSSMGAAAAVLAMQDLPDKPEALVLDSMYANLADSNEGWWLTFVGKRFEWLLRPIPWVTRLITGVSSREVSPERALREIQTPILLLYGRQDLIVPEREANRNVASAPHAEVVWFEECQHSQPRWLQTEKYDEVLLAFLRKNGLLG